MSSSQSLSDRTSWVSPALMVQKNRALSEVRAQKGWVFWLERRPDEAGRSVVVGRAPDGHCQDLTPQGSDVGTSVHVYGGGAWDVRVTEHGVEVVYSDRRQGGVWFSRHGQPSVAWCAEAHRDGRVCHYADLCFAPSAMTVFCVRETHHEGQETAQIVSITEQGDEHVWAEGADFYAAPRPSPNGRFLAWMMWDNPHMPWTETRLAVTALTRGASPTVLEGEAESCSVMEPFWDGTRLYALSDRTVEGQERLWTPIAFDEAQGRWEPALLPPAGAEIGLPAWVFGQRSCVPLEGGGLLARGLYHGVARLLRYEPESGWHILAFEGAPETVPFPLEDGSGRVAWLDAPADLPPAVALGGLEGPIERFRLAWQVPEGVTKEDIATPETLQIDVDDDGPSPLYALFYPPAHGAHCLPAEETPPLVVIVHGGPTGQARTDLSFKVQWWTSRGFAVLDVNYRGSTGFGRAYREALDGQWGVRDVRDCCAAVRYLIAQGRVDPARCVIRGSSAGGLTVLSALAQSDLFVAGTSLYGVTDLRGLVADTHRFEARYTDRLIAPWPEGEAVYRARSPLSWPEKITAPVLFLHGGADKVVPLSQAEALVAQLDGEPQLHIYPHEGHGFRAPDVIVDSLQRELAFYQQVFEG
ncbi:MULTISPECIES: prolyl oligopeptidase family serine peptidase [unclassified Saccharibacter]|uniref:S9 family peptidase n=1 Tax=unclassified Saccharibacter TaxID=2648722 RepID=UPI001EF12B23|nr:MULTISPECIES: prolyl oligopeptidase family serine peptidase [unclassified Saccharibacter]